MTCLWALRRRWMSCSLSRNSSGRRRSGPGFLSSSAPLPRRAGGRGRTSSHLSAFAVQKTVEIPQLQFFNIVVAFSFRAANADPYGPDSSSDHRVSPVAVRFRWSMSLLCWLCCLRCASAVFLLVVAGQVWPLWTRRTVAVA